MTTTTGTLNPRRWLMLPIVLTAAFMAIVDVFIVNVATPSIQADLHASASEVQWLVAAYVLAYAIGLITGGRLGDIYGRRRLFRSGSRASRSPRRSAARRRRRRALLGARFAQGLSAALMFPQMLSVIQVDFHPRSAGAASP